MTAKYDRIGVDYANLRQPDPRIAGHINAALGGAHSVLNVGAGTGSYEPADRLVTALEPSSEMIAQRPEGAAAVVQGVVEALPFADQSFDAVMAVLTVHHWQDQPRGMAEMRRVSRGPIVILTYDPAFRDFWLFDYFPGLVALDDEQMPPIAAYGAWLGQVEVTPVPIPHDCRDGFLSAYWRRPHAYLDPKIRAAMSSFWHLGDVSDGVERLRRDLDSGAWATRYGAVLSQDSRDCGYRLVVAS
ncbi:class I SAM-dependent methyltransferase [Shimia biformata]|uniref:class I SAM-dependent methyltransferase n=1 Tax=Shimia biformata TaxID=1294299 RepID=UPI001950C7CB|nr:class I SAM-dependent methyltransferase [Shimia biformata]